MMALLAERSFAGIKTSEWAALGVWFTGLATVALVFFAVKQIRSAVNLNRTNLIHEQELLREQTRPYVVANLENRSILAIAAFTNIGRTPAFNIEVRLDNRFTSSMSGGEPTWQDSAIFSSNLPMMAPSYCLRFALDKFPDRRAAELDPVVSGTISYQDSHGRRYADERFVIDLSAVGEGLQPDKTIHELVEEVRDLKLLVKDWGKHGRGLRVNTLNEDRSIARENRPMLVSKSLEARSSDGWRAGLRVWTDAWQRRFGWHRW